MHYLGISINFIEMQLFGWKKGELSLVISNGLQHIFKYIKDFFKWLNESAI